MRSGKSAGSNREVFRASGKRMPLNEAPGAKQKSRARPAGRPALKEQINRDVINRHRRRHRYSSRCSRRLDSYWCLHPSLDHSAVGLSPRCHPPYIEKWHRLRNSKLPDRSIHPSTAQADWERPPSFRYRHPMSFHWQQMNFHSSMILTVRYNTHAYRSYDSHCHRNCIR